MTTHACRLALLSLSVAGLLLAPAGCASGTTPSAMHDSSTPAGRAHAALVDVLEHGEKFIKVHAAEILNTRGDTARVRAVFERELERSGEVPAYRVGIWRVLAGAAPSAEERARWVARIASAFVDPAAPDRVGAVESLGKLGQRVDGGALLAAQRMAEGASEAEAMFAWWALLRAGDSRAVGKIAAGLSSSDPVARLRAAYVAGWEKLRQPAILGALARTADREPRSAIGYAIIVSAAVALDADPTRAGAWKSALDEVLASGAPGDRYQVCLMTSDRFTRVDLPRLEALLSHENGDVRVGAAAAILRITDRAAR